MRKEAAYIRQFDDPTPSVARPSVAGAPWIKLTNGVAVWGEISMVTEYQELSMSTGQASISATRNNSTFTAEVDTWVYATIDCAWISGYPGGLSDDYDSNVIPLMNWSGYSAEISLSTFTGDDPFYRASTYMTARDYVIDLGLDGDGSHWYYSETSQIIFLPAGTEIATFANTSGYTTNSAQRVNMSCIILNPGDTVSLGG